MGGASAKDGPDVPDNRRLIVSYLAGFFDGEGCVAARRRGSSADVALEATQLDPAPLFLFQGEFGGSVKRHVGSAWRWRLCGRENILATIEALSPFLVVKKEQAALASLLINLLPPTRTGRPLSSDLSERIHKIVDRLAELKRY